MVKISIIKNLCGLWAEASNEHTDNFGLPKLYALRWITSDFRAYWFYIHTWTGYLQCTSVSLNKSLYLNFLWLNHSCTTVFRCPHHFRSTLEGKKNNSAVSIPPPPLQLGKPGLHMRRENNFGLKLPRILYYEKDSTVSATITQTNGIMAELPDPLEVSGSKVCPSPICEPFGPERTLNKTEAKGKHWEPQTLPPPVFLNTEVTLHSPAASQIHFSVLMLIIKKKLFLDHYHHLHAFSNEPGQSRQHKDHKSFCLPSILSKTKHYSSKGSSKYTASAELLPLPPASLQQTNSLSVC